MRRQCDRVLDGDLVAYLANPDDESLRDVHIHVVDCEECAAELRAWQGLRGDLLLDDSTTLDDHPAEENLVAYGDDPESLGPALRTEIQAHLSACRVCRDEIKVLAGVRIERAAAAETAHKLGALGDSLGDSLDDSADDLADDSIDDSLGDSVHDSEFDIEFGLDDETSDLSADSIPHPAVIDSVGWGQRLRHPAFAFALFLVLTIPALGLLAIDRGVLPDSATSEFGDGVEMEIDPNTLTGRPIARRDTAFRDRASAIEEGRVGDARVGPLADNDPDVPKDLAERNLRSLVMAAQARPESSDPQASITQQFVEQVREVEKSSPSAAELSLADRGGAGSATSAPAVAPPPEQDKRPPSQSAAEQVLTPEQLMAMLETERRVAEMRRRSIEIPDAPEDNVRRGAAVIETLSGDDNGLDSLEEESAGGASEHARSTGMVPPESMILGVRKLGTAPIRGAMIGMAESPAKSSEAESLPALRRRSFDKTRIHFVRGSSYVFTQDEVERGVEVRFPIPVSNGKAEKVEARLVEVGTNRVLVETFAPQGDGLQASPSVSLKVPSGWLSPGRYSVILRSRSADSEPVDVDSASTEAASAKSDTEGAEPGTGASAQAGAASDLGTFSESSIHIRVLASSPTRSSRPAAARTAE